MNYCIRFCLSVFTCVLGFLTAFGAGDNVAEAYSILYATSTDDNSEFLAYDPQTDSWSGKATIDTRAQLAADQNGVVHAYDYLADEIKSYDPVSNSWSSVIAGPGYIHAGNLEVLNDGRYLLSHYSSSTYDLYDGGVWTTGNWSFESSLLGDYDPTTNTLVIGEHLHENAYVIDLTTFSETAYTLGAGSTHERRRAGSILDGVYYQKWDTNNVMGFDLDLPPGPLTDFGEGQDIWYPSSAADRENGLLYFVGISGVVGRNQLDVYDPSTGVYTALANVHPGLGHLSTATIGVGVPISAAVPEPSTYAMAAIGLLGLLAYRRFR